MSKELQEIRDLWAEEFTAFFKERGHEFDDNLDRATIKFLYNKLVRMEARIYKLETLNSAG